MSPAVNQHGMREGTLKAAVLSQGSHPVHHTSFGMGVRCFFEFKTAECRPLGLCTKS